MTADSGSVALLWRGDRKLREPATRESGRLRPVFDALAKAGIRAEPIVYCDAMVEVREHLLRLDGALVWVDPLGGGEDRVQLDAMLREVSSLGVWVSAHPDAIGRMATKEVLYRTKSLGWGTDTHLYATFAEFQERFPARLAEGRPRVVKQNRGNGGIGVWKVVLVPAAATVPGRGAVVRVQHAAPRDAVTEDVPLAAFIDRCEPYFVGGGRVIDQVFVDRLPEGMIRGYVVGDDEVVGFARQRPAVASRGANPRLPSCELGSKTRGTSSSPTGDPAPGPEAGPHRRPAMAGTHSSSGSTAPNCRCCGMPTSSTGQSPTPASTATSSARSTRVPSSRSPTTSPRALANAVRIRMSR